MPGAVFITGETVELRTVEREEIPFLQKNSNDPEMRSFTGHRMPDNAERLRQNFEADSTDADSVQLLVCDDGDPVGLVGLSPKTATRRTSLGLSGCVELGLWIDPREQGNGYGGEAATLATTYAFDELRQHRVCARVFEHNAASRSLFKDRLGYKREGVHRQEAYLDGEYRDVYYYGVLESEWDREAA